MYAPSLQDVIAKIQKLRRLATSSNVHEAAAAAAAADRLVQEHSLQEAQLQSEGVADGERPAEASSPLASWGSTSPQWLQRLAVRLVRHYGCACFLDRAKRGEQHLRIVGRPSDVEIVRYMYAWLSTEIERLAQQHRGRGRSWMNSFRHGAVIGVSDEMAKEKRAAQERARGAGASAAIVLVQAREDEAKAAMRALHSDLRGARSIGGVRDASGFAAGDRAGRSIHRGAALDGRASRALPGGG